MKNNAKIIDTDLILQAGLNPKTGLPVKLDNQGYALRDDIKKQLRIKDEQTAINRYKWNNLPANLTSQELERMLYYKGQLCFFYDNDLEEYYFMPYALDGTIDFYGRYNTIHPVPMTSGTEDKGNKAQAELLARKKLKCIYDEKQIKDNDPNTLCVLLHDYSKQLSQTIIPRVTLQDSLLNTMAECIPLMRTSLYASSGVKGIRVNDADQADSVADGNRGLKRGALIGEPFVPMIGNLEFQELTNSNVANAQDFMLSMQSLENFRLSTYGIDGGGVFEKKEHTLQDEQDMNKGPASLINNDGLYIRQHFCELANKMFGLDMSVEDIVATIAAENNVTESDGAEKTKATGGSSDEN